jgi:hypothetical protein
MNILAHFEREFLTFFQEFLNNFFLFKKVCNQKTFAIIRPSSRRTFRQRDHDQEWHYVAGEIGR